MCVGCALGSGVPDGERGVTAHGWGTRARASRGSKTMFGSTTPVSEHPVHRANAMLRSALMSEASFPRPDFIEDFATLAGPDDGPIGIAYPQSLVARLNDLDVGLDASGGIRVPLSFVDRKSTRLNSSHA